MKKSILILVFLIIFTIIVPVQGQSIIHGAEIHKQESYNGKFLVSIRVNNEWIDAGSLAFDKYQNEKTIDIHNYLTSNNVMLRITQKGGGSSYLDSVFLDGNPAISVNDGDVKLLGKLVKTDFDVVSPNEGVVFEFSRSNVRGILTIVGRIESEVISKEPLQFPEINNYKTLDAITDFYSYSLNSNIGTIKVDGILDEINNLEPFVEEYRTTGSGHPSGNTYFWVINDNENLYVAIDVTPDNTFDGDKDYAKVYVNTTEGIKEFKVSVPETKWGNTAFTYTDKVSYEHKVYEFVIPFSEMGVNLNNNNKLEIAFAIYGTVSLVEGYHKPDIAYDSYNDLYLSVFEHVYQLEPGYNVSQIYGQIVSNKGELVGKKFRISKMDAPYSYKPAVSYDAANHKFLVVWQDNSSDYKIKGQLISISENRVASLEGSIFNISGNEDYHSYDENNYFKVFYEYDPDLTYDSLNERFLVVWTQQCNDSPPVNTITGSNIFGRLIDSSSDFVGESFPICTDIGDQNYPSLTYSYGHEAFLVVWNEYHSEDEMVIAAQVVGELGDVKDEGKLIISEDEYGYFPSVSINNLNDQFLVTWGMGRIYGSYISLYLEYGSLVPKKLKNNFLISSNDYDYYSEYPSSFYDGYEDMLTVWTSSIVDTNKRYAQLSYIDYNGIVGDDFFTDESLDDCDLIESYQSPVSITGNNNRVFLIAYEVLGSSAIGYKIIGNDVPIVEPDKTYISFDRDNYTVQAGNTFQSNVTLYNSYEMFQALAEEKLDIDITESVIYDVANSSIAEITTTGAIKGITAGTTTISAIYYYTPVIPYKIMSESINDNEVEGIELRAEALVTVTPIPVQPNTSSSSPVKVSVGQILVDNKVVENIYKEDVKFENGYYNFSTLKFGDKSKLWLKGSYFKEIKNKSPKGIIRFIWDGSSYFLPLNCNEILLELDNVSNSKVNIIIDKIEDKDILDSINKASAKIGGKNNFGTIKFSVNVENANKNIEINSYDFYCTRTASYLGDIDEYNSTVMKYIKDKETLTFVPSAFEAKNGEVKVTIKYRGNGIFTILENPQSFSDIKDHWGKINIEKLAARNIAFGKNKDMNTFEPNDNITRAEFAVMITRALGITEEVGTESFKDITNQWFAEDIKTAYDSGLINGKNDGKFYPNEKIMRKDIAVIINNALKFANKDTEVSSANSIISKFKDKEILDNYAVGSIALCADTKIIIGRDTGNFDPNDYATRAEASAIIERMLKYLQFIN